MKKTTLFSIAIIIMIVLNGILLFILYTKPGSLGQGVPRPEPKQVIIDKLQFTPEQITAYEDLIKGHRHSINKFDAEIRTTKGQLYSLLSKEGNEQEQDSLIMVINHYQKEIEQVHFKHFEDIKALCNAEQKIYFEQLVPELPRLFGPRPPMGPPGRQEGPEGRP